MTTSGAEGGRGSGSGPLEAYESFYRRLRETVEANPEIELDEVRAILEHWGDHTREPGGVDYVEDAVAGVPVLWATPRGCRSDRVVLCSHGGGYSCGSSYTHRKMYAHLAKAIGCRAAIVDFRRIPENPFPAPLDDVHATFAGLLAEGLSGEHIALVGDSAGGALAITVALRARRDGLPMPATSVALSPWVDLEATSSEYEAYAASDAVNSAQVVRAMGAVVAQGSGDLRDPWSAPIYADLSGLSPIYIQVGGAETFVGDARLLADAARSAGVEVSLDVFEGMQHCFQMLAGFAPEADEAVARIADWVRPRIGLSNR